jgi:hypothetical protein
MREKIDWSKSLGGIAVDPLSTVEVRRILFGLVRDRCADIGLREGERIRCHHRDGDNVTVEMPSGTLANLELSYAWFIEVTPVSRPKQAGSMRARSRGSSLLEDQPAGA